MELIKTAGPRRAEQALGHRLSHELEAGKRVVWLVSGGSNIVISVAIMSRLPQDQTQNLVVIPMDERYGEVGHLNSNAKQLLDAGFETKDAVFVHPLIPGFSLEETSERFAVACEQAFAHADVVIGQAGIGTDGHIAGILPRSTAIEATGWAVSYKAPTFTRITLTFDALRRVSVMYACAFGSPKKPALLALRDEDLPLADQPAQLLKQLPEAYVYNDQIEGVS